MNNTIAPIEVKILRKQLKDIGYKLSLKYVSFIDLAREGRYYANIEPINIEVDYNYNDIKHLINDDLKYVYNDRKVIFNR